MSVFDSNNSRFLVSVYFVGIPIFIGTLIYVLSRDSSVYFIRFLHLDIVTVELPYWIKYNLPDGLWAFAFVSLLTIVWKGEYSREYHIWLSLVICIAVFLEVFYGTFDWYDLLFILVGMVISYYVFRRIKFKN
ncbi:MAG: hypothetical protein LBE34_15295 [Flavobacteriaceae bacterium]|jgi:hypothetical protein|nr:hypothetical protein [Flavobacteriaceae bacterium]